jgi:hypothetical protein
MLSFRGAPNGGGGLTSFRPQIENYKKKTETSQWNRVMTVHWKCENKTGNVRVKSLWGAFTKPLLPCKTRSIICTSIFLCVWMRGCMWVCECVRVRARQPYLSIMQSACAVLSSVAPLTPQYFSSFYHKRHNFWKKSTCTPTSTHGDRQGMSF